MAFDEVFNPLPRFTDAEIQEIPEVARGELVVKMRKGVLNLTRVRTSESIEEWVVAQQEEGKGLVVRQGHRFDVDGATHAVAWVGEHGGEHYIVCDHIPEIDPESVEYDEHIFSCRAVVSAINYRATRSREILQNDNYLKRTGDEDSLRQMAYFLVKYAHYHPEAWIGTHRGGVGLIGGLAQTFRRPYQEMKDLAIHMQDEGLVEIGGVGDQVVSLKQAA